MSEFLVLTSAFAQQPVLAIIAAGGLLVAFGALLWRLNQIAFGEPIGAMTPVRASYVPIFAHLGLVLIGGIAMPGVILVWFQNVAMLLK